MANVLLVLGNGFDLACGLHSSFEQFLASDFYSDVMDKIGKLDKGFSTILKVSSKHKGFDINGIFDVGFDDSLSFWDLYYGLPYYYQQPNVDMWCDFETCLNKFLLSVNGSNGEYSEIMNMSNYVVERNSFEDGNFKRKMILNEYLNQYLSEDSNQIYNKLLVQLKKFEHRFGDYIRTEQITKQSYIANAKALINKMVEADDKVVCINDFNYSNLSEIIRDIWFINGDTDNPIFGVDFPGVEPGDERYIFTKTYRRLELGNKASYAPSQKDYTKVLVFGHSLNKQDYSYFYSLFNILGLTNNRNINRRSYSIQFLYSKYADKTSDEVRTETISRVLNMLYAYNQEVLHEQNFRLIDILYSTKAISFREIEI